MQGDWKILGGRKKSNILDGGVGEGQGYIPDRPSCSLRWLSSRMSHPEPFTWSECGWKGRGQNPWPGDYEPQPQTLRSSQNWLPCTVSSERTGKCDRSKTHLNQLWHYSKDISDKRLSRSNQKYIRLVTTHTPKCPHILQLKYERNILKISPNSTALAIYMTCIT